MSRFKIVKPKKTVNLVPNPSFELWLAPVNLAERYPIAWAPIAGSESFVYEEDKTTYSGGGALRLLNPGKAIRTTKAMTDPIYFANASAGEDDRVTFSMYAYIEQTTFTDPSMEIKVEGGNDGLFYLSHNFTVLQADYNKWNRLIWTFNINQIKDFNLKITCINGDWLLDALQLEIGPDATVFTEGNLEGCKWESEMFTSPSIRELGGGKVYDIKDDLGVKVNWGSGLGRAQLDHVSDTYGSIDGGYLTDITLPPRQVVLGVTLAGGNEDALLDNRETLGAVITPERFPKLNPLTLRFERTKSGVTTERELQAFYSEGLNGDRLGGSPIEQTPIRFMAYDPLMKSAQHEACPIAPYKFNDSFARVAVRKPSGDWAGWIYVNGIVRQIKFTDDSKRMYICGDFTLDAFDAGVPLRHVAMYDFSVGYPYTEVNGGLNGTPYDMAYSPKWGLVFTGSFTTKGNSATPMRGVARYDINTNTWYDLCPGGAPNTVAQTCAIWGDILAVGGTFTTINGQAIPYFALCDLNTGTWSAPAGTAINAPVFSLCAGDDGSFYPAGSFTAAGGLSSLGKVARYYQPDGTWFALSTGVDLNVTQIYIGSDKTLYVGGSGTSPFVPAKGIIVAFNGSTWQQMGDGPAYKNDAGTYRTVAAIVEDNDGSIIVGGNFTKVQGSKYADKLGRYNRSVWFPVPINLPGDAMVYSAARSKQGHIALGFDTVGSGTSQFVYAGNPNINLATVSGDAPTYAQFRISGPGNLQVIKNATTGQELNCKYVLLQGEHLIVDTTPGKVRVVSNYFGNVVGRFFADGSELNLVLLPGNNEMVGYIDGASNQYTQIRMYWQPAWWGLD